MLTAQRAYQIFRDTTRYEGWPEWAGLAQEAQRAFQIIADEAKGGSAAPTGLQEGEYPNAKVLPGWTFDTITYDGQTKVKLMASVELPLADGSTTACRFEWIIDDLTNKDGTDLSGGFRSILAAGVTEADLAAWQRGGPLVGLDRNKVTAVVATDKGGYLKVKYLNRPGGPLVAKAPPTRAQMVQVGQNMLATLARLGKGSKTPDDGSGKGPGVF